MLSNPISAVLAVLVILAVAAIMAHRWVYGMIEVNASDVVPFLRIVSLEDMRDLFHPDADELHRQSHSSREFRMIQWKRVRLGLQYVSDLAFNARILQAWSRTERRRGDLSPQLDKITSELLTVCMQCRATSFFVSFHLHIALIKMALLPFLAPPDFGWLMRHGSYDLIGFYEKMRAKAGEFGLAYDNEQYYERLMQVL
ncbi:MAG: hypothetical protein DMG65_14890 [Candidatus Angelobacter sp. Gp1-AA117]|nr:MAG: hypothetical protein DMG65_14890 [Candidatus Angelobacter sp. Gp1-AA117]